MSKHKMVDGRLLQMDKSFGQLKQKQKEKNKVDAEKYRSGKQQPARQNRCEVHGAAEQMEDLKLERGNDDQQ